MIPTGKQLKRMRAIKDLRRMWGGLAWVRVRRNKAFWFELDYRFIRHETHKTGLILPAGQWPQ